jgi:hypothetical protein
MDTLLTLQGAYQMIDFTCLFPGFTKSPSAQAPAPAPIEKDDPAAEAAKEKLRLSEKRRKGRLASILTGSSGAEKEGVIKTSSALGGSNGAF